MCSTLFQLCSFKMCLSNRIFVWVETHSSWAPLCAPPPKKLSVMLEHKNIPIHNELKKKNKYWRWIVTKYFSVLYLVAHMDCGILGCPRRKTTIVGDVEMSLVVALKRWPYVVPWDGYKDASCNQRCVRNLGWLSRSGTAATTAANQPIEMLLRIFVQSQKFHNDSFILHGCFAP